MNIAARQLDISESKQELRILECHSQRYIDLVFGGDNFQVANHLFIDVQDKECEDLMFYVQKAAMGGEIPVNDAGELMARIVRQMSEEFRTSTIAHAEERGITYE